MSEAPKHEQDLALHVGAGVALGAGIGTALGTAFGNIGVGVALGAAVGTAIGAALALLKKKNAGSKLTDVKAEETRMYTFKLAAGDDR